MEIEPTLFCLFVVPMIHLRKTKFLARIVTVTFHSNVHLQKCLVGMWSCYFSFTCIRLPCSHESHFSLHFQLGAATPFSTSWASSQHCTSIQIEDGYTFAHIWALTCMHVLPRSLCSSMCMNLRAFSFIAGGPRVCIQCDGYILSTTRHTHVS